MSTYREIPGPVEGYKIFNDDMTCRGKQYAPGMNELGDDLPLELCEHGIHFCEQLAGCWAYYASGRIFKVRAYGVLDLSRTPGSDYKMVCRRIEVLEEVTITGDRNTGSMNTGDRNTGFGNTGFRNTGSMNTGDRNTGDMNTGDRNTGNMNTGSGNCCDRSAGWFCSKTPKMLVFDRPSDLAEPTDSMYALAERLSQDESFDPAPFLSIPNATPARICALHKKMIAARKQQG